MSLSRLIALSINDTELLNQIFTQIAKEVLRKGGRSRDKFDGAVYPQLHALHAGGFSKEKLKELRHISRIAFQAEKNKTRDQSSSEKSGEVRLASQQESCSGSPMYSRRGLPAVKYADPDNHRSQLRKQECAS